MMSIAVITSVYDNYDPLPDVVEQPGLDIDWVCVTDDPDLTGPGWRMIVDPVLTTPRRAAKNPKLHPWRYTDAPASLWLDAAFQLDSHTAVAELFAYGSALAMFAHPIRSCFYAEADALAESHRTTDTRPIYQQTELARQVGLPDEWGLWCSGLIVRWHVPEVLALSDAWADEMDRHHDEHDQHSFVVACWKHGIRPYVLPGGYDNNPWAIHRPSIRHFT